MGTRPPSHSPTHTPSGPFSIEHTTDGKTWQKSIEVGGGQSAESFPNSNLNGGKGKGFAVVAAKEVLVSTGGATSGDFFKAVKITGVDTATYPGRYGAYPSENTWFVTAGSFPSAPAPPPAPAGAAAADWELVHELTERVQIRKDTKTGKTFHHLVQGSGAGIEFTPSTAYSTAGGMFSSTDGEHYGNPFNGPCLAGETNLTYPASDGGGSICSTICKGTKECPTDEPRYNTIPYRPLQTMYCNAMQCNAMQCNAMQCNAMQCNAMQCNADDDVCD